MIDDENLLYDNPLITRYASKSMSKRWGPQRKHETWRKLWLALAEAEFELSLTREDGKTPRITPAALEELKNHLSDIDFAKSAEYEKKFRHDVMAHVHTLADSCPLSRDIIHLGATSCYVTDNTDLILMKESLDAICAKLGKVIIELSGFAKKWKNLPTLGYTHFQPAQLTTVGKRACLWCYDLVLDLEELEHRRDQLVFRGVKGTTGTQASFLTLFHGDHDKVKQLDELIAKKMGFSHLIPVTGQTYTRKIDSQILDAISGLGQSVHKWGTDLRLLAHRQEIDEPFESDQIGSSAMAYKRNPMRSERMCSLGRFVIGLPAMAANTMATQWFERTLDDSAIRRLYLPQSFLAADAILRLANNIVSGLQVNEAVISKSLWDYFPYMITEDVMMTAVSAGGDRQTVHESIRKYSHQVTKKIKEGKANSSELIELLKSDSTFAKVDWDSQLEPLRYVGRAPEQVDEFVQTIIKPIEERYSHLSIQTDKLQV